MIGIHASRFSDGGYSNSRKVVARAVYVVIVRWLTTESFSLWEKVAEGRMRVPLRRFAVEDTLTPTLSQWEREQDNGTGQCCRKPL